MKTPYSLEPRLASTRTQRALVPFASVLAALILGAGFLAVQGHQPLAIYQNIVSVSFTTTGGLADSLTVAIPLALTALAASVGFRMNLFNVGAEGQLYAGAIGGTWAALVVAPNLPRVLAVLVVLVVGTISGVVWMLPVAFFRARFGTSEIISSLMLTFVALFTMRFLIFGSRSLWRDSTVPQFPKGRPIPVVAELARFGDTRLHLGIVVAIVAAIAVWLLVKTTAFGYAMEVVGRSVDAARYAGIGVASTIVGALALSGGLAGLAGATEVAGRSHTLDPEGLALGLGFTGIVVAALARNNPIAILPIAALLGGLRNAGPALQASGSPVPPEVSLMLQGAILLFAIGGEVFVRYRLVRREAPATVGAPA